MTTNQSGRQLFRLIGGTKRWIALTSALGIVTIGAGIGLVAMAIYLLTKAALLGSAASLSLTILGVRFFAVTRVVGRYCERYFGHLGTFRVLTRLRVWLFSSLVRSDVLARSGRRRGDVVAGLVDDVEVLQDRLLRVSVPCVVALGVFIISCSVLLVIEPKTAGFLAVAFLLGAVLLPVLLRSRTLRAGGELVELRARRLAHAAEFLAGLETLHIWGQTQRFTLPLAEMDNEDALVTRTFAKARSFISAGIVAVTGFCVLAIVLSIASTNSETTQLWWLAATPLIAMASFEAIGPMLSMPEHKNSSDAAARHILALTQNDSALISDLDAASTTQVTLNKQPTIELSDVSFSYTPHDRVFSGASLRIAFGSVVVIAAASGHGKSTLLNLLLGELACDTGEIRVGGRDPIDSSNDRRPTIAAVLQDDHLFDSTIRDNLLVGDGEATDEKILEVCGIAGLAHVLSTKDTGLDAPVGPNGELLSGGERQRIMIARALLAEAPILILDEAAEHLEAEMRTEIVNSILRKRSGLTTVFLAHDNSAIASADYVYDLIDGKFVLR